MRYNIQVRTDGESGTAYPELTSDSYDLALAVTMLLRKNGYQSVVLMEVETETRVRILEQ